MTKDEIMNEIKELENRLSILKQTLCSIIEVEERAKKEKIRASMTHIGVRHKNEIYLRETRAYFVDEFGNKYKKYDKDSAFRRGDGKWRSTTYITNIRPIKEATP